jgi:hypothetical protein
MQYSLSRCNAVAIFQVKLDSLTEEAMELAMCQWLSLTSYDSPFLVIWRREQGLVM